MTNGGDSWFEATDREAVDDFWRVYDANYDVVFGSMLAQAKQDPSLANVIRSMSSAEIDAMRNASRARLERTVHGAPSEYEQVLRHQAAAWVRHGVGFTNWYIVARALADQLRPLLIWEYGASPARLDAALRLMNRYFDRSMSVLGSEYIAAKEAMLRESEARKAAILDASLDAVVTMAADGKILEVNLAATRIFGFSRDELLSGSCEQIIPERLREAHRKGLSRYLATGVGNFIGKRVELTARRADGTEFPIEIAVVRIAHEGPPVFTAYIRDITDARRAREELRESREQLRALAARVQDAREEEGRRIAREVHDVLGQMLTAIKLDCGFVSKRVAAPVDEASRGQLAERCTAIDDTLDRMLESVRRIANELRPPALDDLGLEAAIESQARDFERRTDIAVALDLPERELDLRQEVATALFRIFQEALTNVARHAQASRVEVSLAAEPSAVALVVRDDGRGIDDADTKRGALGIVGMRERAKSLGGSLDIEAPARRGTTVRVMLPLAPRRPAQS